MKTGIMSFHDILVGLENLITVRDCDWNSKIVPLSRMPKDYFDYAEEEEVEESLPEKERKVAEFIYQVRHFAHCCNYRVSRKRRPIALI